MDSLDVILIYIIIIFGASLVLKHLKPYWTRQRIAFLTSSLVPFAGIALAVFTYTDWLLGGRTHHDTDPHAMSTFNAVLLVGLSVLVMLGGYCISLLATWLGGGDL